ncbi:hypothetical protein GW17_00029384 [Ensete ventricosum]|nr:hypothetical protein GW17_00029384 [Ensete ventricosum]RZS24142.1 hypothetical protein BHM03_00057177 [Ensete ventricosum]
MDCNSSRLTPLSCHGSSCIRLTLIPTLDVSKSWKSPEIWKSYISNHVVCALGIDEDNDGLLLEKPFDLHCLLSGGMERETAAGRVHFDSGHDQGSWQRKIAAGYDVDRLQ